MLPAPAPLVEPAPRALARLLRVPFAPTGALYGGDIGDDVGDNDDDEDQEPEWLREAGGVLAVDRHAVTTDSRAAPPLTARELTPWLVRTLGEQRGVLAAWPAVGGLGARPAERVLAISGKTAAGHAWWWLWALQRARYSRRDSYAATTAHCASATHTVYHIAGEPDRAADFFPTGAAYGIARGVIDAHLHYGVAVTLREFPPHGREPSLDAQTQQASTAAYLALDAATHGVGPPVFATMLVHEDEYAALQQALLPANAAVTQEMADSLRRERSTRLRGAVTVGQLHSFRLSEMLRTYVEMGAAQNRAGARAEIVRASAEVARKTRQLAELKTLKLNMSPDTVVFCPELVDTPDGDWELRGFGFRSGTFARPQGVPFLADFDPRFCRRFGTSERADGYDASAATALMLFTLLETTRAQHGGGAASAVCEGVAATLNVALGVGSAKFDEFGAAVRRAFVHGRVERDALPSSLVDAVASAVGAEQLRSGEASGPLVPLVALLVGARRYCPTETPSNEEMVAARDEDSECRARLREVRAARDARLRARCDAARSEK